MSSKELNNRLRVLLVAPSLDILGGQSRQAVRLREGLSREPDLEIGFLPHNPRLPGILRSLQNIKYVRTFVTTLFYVALLLWRVRKYDIIHIFCASYYSYSFCAIPALLITTAFWKEIHYQLSQRRGGGPSRELANGRAVTSIGLMRSWFLPVIS